MDDLEAALAAARARVDQAAAAAATAHAEDEALRGELAEERARATALTNDIARLGVALGAAVDALREANDRAAYHLHVLEDVRTRLDMLERSTSWRLGAPIRLAGRLVRPRSSAAVAARPLPREPHRYHRGP